MSDAKTCAFCSQPVLRGNDNQGRPAKYCSRQCNDAAQNAAKMERRRAARPPRFCDQCAIELDRTKPGSARFCSTVCQYTWNNRTKAAVKTAVKLATRKPCRKCGGLIPDDRQANAIYCSEKCNRNGREHDPAKAQAYNRRYKYGITAEAFDALLAIQGGVCAVCRSDEWPGKDNRPHIDHCHATGRIRGILCGRCNTGLGQFGDDPARLRAAADYLERT